MRTLISALMAGFGVLFAPGTLRITRETDSHLDVQCASQLAVFNKRAKTIKAGRQPLAPFDQFVRIELVHHWLNEGNSESWSIFLSRGAVSSRLWIGTCSEPLEASLIGARISEFMGKPIRALDE